ncbi:MAG: HEAT repeat domain-containing protein [Planctomycetes bacterium]|nr:HEAT repeat domain-containing protein [Planctomycetota bacterium]
MRLLALAAFLLLAFAARAEPPTPEETETLRTALAAASPDSRTSLRVEACHALHDRWGRSAFLDAIFAVASDMNDPALAIRATHVLAEQGDMRAAGTALGLLDRPEAGRLGDVVVRFRPKGAAAALAALLEDGDTHNDRNAVEWLEALRDKTALPALRKALRHPSPDVRKCVPLALAAIGATDAAADLAPLLADPDLWVRKYTTRAAGELGLRETIPAVTKILDEMKPFDQDERWVRLEAIVALAALGAEGGLKRLGENLGWLDLAMTRGAIRVMAAVPGAEGAAMLEAGLKGTRWQDEYAGALMARLDPACNGIVGDYLSSMEARARIAAAGWLAMAGDKRGMETLETMLRSGEDAGRRTLAAIWCGRARRGGAPLLRHFADFDAGTSVAAAWSLGEVFPPVDSDDLATLLEKEQVAEIRMFLRASLDRCRGQEERIRPKAAKKAAADLRDMAGTRWDPVAVRLAVMGQVLATDEDSARFLIESLDDARRVPLEAASETILEGEIRFDAVIALYGISAVEFRMGDDMEEEIGKWKKWWADRNR